jgi:hypothetical protein
MTSLHLTIGLDPGPGREGGVVSSSDEVVAELTRTIAAAYTARGTARWVRGERDLALSDLDSALHHDPDSGEARLVRSFVRKDRGDDVAEADLNERRVLGLGEYGPVPGRSYLMAGYALVADPEPFGGVGDALLETYPLTPEERDDAVAWADYHSRMPSLREEVVLGSIPARDPNFDAIVVEIRAVARVIHLGEPMNDDGHLLPRRLGGEVPTI